MRPVSACAGGSDATGAPNSRVKSAGGAVSATGVRV
jgi:hypothetical protein